MACLQLSAPDPSFESVLIAVMIASTSLAPSSVVGRLLEYQHLKFLGVISYSLYVWQELFLVLHWGPIGVLLLPIAGL
jgi:peptidoglycan/LPS O-acetylase OafA/YrhL